MAWWAWLIVTWCGVTVVCLASLAAIALVERCAPFLRDTMPRLVRAPGRRRISD
jgi:hypothetical protein